ncbi:GNAT family N-acetyltransferase [Pseudoduganella violacea]|uniref:Ribosomal-protein-alanine N-acetyltransferase n=1 Tax=Pseudoduganella violacea TaxID=1715466 RepID=A0A7W5BAP2_9BURK|nr:GNAT family N-acetyltransferase [Pseudoduganella violacea]MBB3119653.1 ribosomal-protein-alanine N-acetyltransferase [Pseudoduganella violacea]
MTTVTIRTLRHEDASALLDFELQNRAWFARHITARPADVYSPEGIVRHIEECLNAYRQGTMHPSLLLDASGVVLGRANLKDIDRAKASSEIGYRVAEQSAGGGLATQAVRHMQQVAREEWQLKMLEAYVTAHNPASARVLLKCGFRQGEYVEQLALVNGEMRDGHRYQYDLNG